MSPAPPQISPGELAAEGSAVLASNAFGRSRKLAELFEYLLACSTADHAPKEVEIADKVFGGMTRGADGDATVRAHVHRLRAKLEEHYSQSASAWRIAIPKGAYRLVLEPNASSSEPAAVRAGTRPRTGLRIGALIAAAAFLFLLGFLAARWIGLPSPDSPLAQLRRGMPWQPIVSGDRPITIVAGDYFLFAELNESGRPRRLIRDFEINSPADLEAFKLKDRDASVRFLNVGQSYLPIVIGDALRQIVPITRSHQGKLIPNSVITSSQLQPTTLKQNNIIFLGNLRGLGALRAPLFAGSRFGFDEAQYAFVDKQTGHRFPAGTQIEESAANLGRAYAIVSLFKGPADNWVLIIAGTRNAALVQASEFLTQSASLGQLNAKLAPGQPFDALLAVDGLSGSGLRATIVTTYPRAMRQNWSGG